MNQKLPIDKNREMTNRTIRIGQIGCNGVAFEHGRGAELVPFVQLVAVCDLNRERLKTFGERFKVDTYSDYSKLLERNDIDLISIVTPDETHAEIAVAAAKAGKNILIEKPFASSLDEAEKIIIAVKENGVKAMCAQSQRFVPKFKKAKEVVSSGRIGVPVFARISNPSSPFWTEQTWSKLNGSRQASWLLMHNGMHQFDYLSWLFESLPLRIYTRSHPGQSAREGWLNTHEYVSTIIRFENGCIAQSEENRIMQPAGYPFHCEFYVVGTNGTLDLSDRLTHSVSLWNRNGLSFPGAHVTATDLDHPFAGEIAHIARCIIDNTEPDISLEFSYKVLKAVVVGCESLKLNTAMEC